MENLKSNPVLVDYAKCVEVLSLKTSFTAWTTLYLIMVSRGGKQ